MYPIIMFIPDDINILIPDAPGITFIPHASC